VLTVGSSVISYAGLENVKHGNGENTLLKIKVVVVKRQIVMPVVVFVVMFVV
jgi:hypothetical protein